MVVEKMRRALREVGEGMGRMQMRSGDARVGTGRYMIRPGSGVDRDKPVARLDEVVVAQPPSVRKKLATQLATVGIFCKKSDIATSTTISDHKRLRHSLNGSTE